MYQYDSADAGDIMTLLNEHSRSKLIRQFTALGPYIREEKCKDNQFFFDCLAVCVSAKPAPDKREFWGWWMILEAQNDHLYYRYQFGLFDQAGLWVSRYSKDEKIEEQVEQTMHNFHSRLCDVCQHLGIEMIASDIGTEQLIKLTH